MNYKIILGISTVTILTLIYQYIKNLFNPNKRLLEGQNQELTQEDILNARYGGDRPENNNGREIGKSGSELVDTESIFQQRNQTRLLQGIYDELGEFNHIYQERLFESLIPSQIIKTIIHLSSIDHSNDGIGNYVFDLASTNNSGLRKFNNIINIKLLSAQIPYIPHNIYVGDGIHNKLKFIELTEIIIPEGKYTIYSLINKINNLLTNISLAFNSTTYFISIKNSRGSDITIDTSYPLWKRLGIHEQITIPNGIVYDCVYIPDISVHYIDIVSSDIHPKGSTLTNNDSTILKRLPLTGQMGDLIYYEANHSDYVSQEFFMPDISSNLATLTLNLKRHDGTPYDLKKLHFDLKLEISELIEPTLLNELASHMRRDRERFIDNEGSVEIGGIDYALNN